MTMKCLFTEVHQFHVSSKMVPKYQSMVVFKYHYVNEIVYVNQTPTSLARTGIFFQNNLHIFNLLTIMFISMFDIQYRKVQ